jgi:hypothetical protein
MTTPITSFSIDLYHTPGFQIGMSHANAITFNTIMAQRPDLHEKFRADLGKLIGDVLKQEDNSWGHPCTTYLPPKMIAAIAAESKRSGVPIENVLVSLLRSGMERDEEIYGHASDAGGYLQIAQAPQEQPASEGTPTDTPSVQEPAVANEPVPRTMTEALSEGTQLVYMETENSSYCWENPQDVATSHDWFEDPEKQAGDWVSAFRKVSMCLVLFDENERIFMVGNDIGVVLDEIAFNGVPEGNQQTTAIQEMVDQTVQKLTQQYQWQPSGTALLALSEGLRAVLSDRDKTMCHYGADDVGIYNFLQVSSTDFPENRQAHFMPSQEVERLYNENLLTGAFTDVIMDKTQNLAERVLYKYNSDLVIKSRIPSSAFGADVQAEPAASTVSADERPEHHPV